MHVPRLDVAFYREVACHAPQAISALDLVADVNRFDALASREMKTNEGGPLLGELPLDRRPTAAGTAFETR